MTENQQTTSNDRLNELQTHLTEYEKLREEILQTMGSQEQRIVIALGSASVAVPLLAGQTGNIPSNVIASLLYGLAIVYAVIGMNFVGGWYGIAVISKYIREHLEPAINQLVKPPTNHRLLYWESFARSQRTSFFAAILWGAGAIGSALLLLLPGAFALLTAQYVLAMPILQTPHTATPEFVSSLLIPLLSIVGWCAYLATVLLFVLMLKVRNLVAD